MRNPSVTPLLAGILFTGFLAGCITDGGDARIGSDIRYYQDGLYTDTQLRYSLRLPSGWKVQVDSFPYALYNFTFTRSNATVTGWYSELDPKEPLEAYVAHRTGPHSVADSEIVHPMESRGGVPVIAVDTWRFTWNVSILGGREDIASVERARILYFVRVGQLAAIRFTQSAKTAPSDSLYRPIDSSLTFF